MGTTERCEDFFPETSFGGILETNDFLHLENPSPFLGVILARLRRQSNEVPLATMSTQYVRLFHYLFRINRRPVWTSFELFCFESCVGTFMKYSVHLFGAYETPALRTTKWHILAHLIFDLSKMDEVSYIIADLYESSHKTTKCDYKKTSERLYFVMSETWRLQNTRHRTSVSGVHRQKIREDREP